jgi:hypothetical protein
MNNPSVELHRGVIVLIYTMYITKIAVSLH